ncbi:MAG: DUF5615 family PIN-like protein [Prochlorotrichaceae cyanobacterium]
MSKIGLYLDEDMMSHSLVQALQTRGVDVTTALEQSREGLSDEEQLKWAASQYRVICTGNVADFVQLHRQFLEAGDNHSGILIIPQQQYSIGDCLRGIMQLVISKTAEEAKNELYFLGNLLRNV